MDAELGAQWISYATKQPLDQVLELLDDDQLVTLGKWLSKNKLLNPPKSNTKKHVGEFMCKCGCGETFTAEYTTKRPQFKNEAHRMRYWRAKQGKTR
jgi:hypothetical protein